MLPRAGGQAALDAHLSADICQDEPSDISCVGSKKFFHPSSYIPYRIRKLKPLPMSRCLPSARGNCWSTVLRSCRMGTRFSEVDSTGDVTMLEFLRTLLFLCKSAFCIVAAASVLRVIVLSEIFNARDKKNRTSASKDIDVLLIKFLVRYKLSKGRSSSPLSASP
jgi:hypothetical protein